MLLEVNGLALDVTVRWVDCHQGYFAALLSTKPLSQDVTLRYMTEPVPHWTVQIEDDAAAVMTVAMDSHLKSALLSWVSKDCGGFGATTMLNETEYA